MDTPSLEELEEAFAKAEAVEKKATAERQRIEAEISKAKQVKHAENVGRVRQFMRSVDVTYEDLAPLQVTPINKDVNSEPKSKRPKQPTFKHPTSGKPLFKVGHWRKTIKKLIDSGYTFEDLVINKADTEKIRAAFHAGPNIK